MFGLTVAVLEFAILLAVSVAAHMLVAYVYAPRRAVKRVEEWFSSPVGQQVVGQAVKTIVVPELQAAIPEPPEMPELPKVDPQAIADQVFSHLELRLYGKAANAARSAQTSLEKIISGVRTGNATVDGVLSMIPLDVKGPYIKAIARALRNSGLGALAGEEPKEEEGAPSGVWKPGDWT